PETPTRGRGDELEDLLMLRSSCIRDVDRGLRRVGGADRRRARACELLEQRRRDLRDGWHVRGAVSGGDELVGVGGHASFSGNVVGSSGSSGSVSAGSSIGCCVSSSPANTVGGFGPT